MGPYSSSDEYKDAANDILRFCAKAKVNAFAFYVGDLDQSGLYYGTAVIRPTIILLNFACNFR